MRLGEELGREALPGAVYALTGELGAGKTVIAKGIARGLMIPDEITSPTFTLLEIYRGRLPLYHFDLYRIARADEFDELGFEEYWYGDGVSIIEWADNAAGLLPNSAVRVLSEYAGPHARRITIEHPGD
ncbi:MAG: tRNA (adenosine(37)-N6)-threonylcarbamoyltransferase complex ATPase subunit type 1 TsaE [Spirochaetes bacterium]|nr:MAG: tRNA (adenosine(37)-N6)-threonylcarbamoyltransferase complex ATPase subunit type 1 TsaE [Spirochaetota bacterium]